MSECICGRRLMHDCCKEIARLEAALAEAKKQRDHELSRLAACGVAAMGNTKEAVVQRIDRDNPYWSASYGDVCASVDREMDLRSDLAALKASLPGMIAEAWATAIQIVWEWTYQKRVGGADIALIETMKERAASERARRIE